MSSQTNAYIKTVNIDKTESRYLLGALDKVISWTQDSLAGIKWEPVQLLARETVFKALSKIERGELKMICGDEVWTFGNPYILTCDGYSKSLEATIEILDQAVWIRLFLNAEFGFADAFMLGLIKVSSLTNVFQIFVLNRQEMSNLGTIVSPLFSFASYITNSRLSNKLLGSTSNISAHYDLSNEMFAAFLSKDMTYSCAVFDEESGGCIGDLVNERFIAPPCQPSEVFKDTCNDSPPDDLERGQIAKLRLLAKRARITERCRVLDVGCGWGSFAIFVAKEYGARVDAITISENQKLVAAERVEAAGLSDVITIHLMDYREMPESFHHSFDAVVSIGVMEHVGVEFMDQWFRQMSWVMKPENSVKAFTMTTVPDTRWEDYSRDVDFIRKYIYPGGQLSSVANLVKSCTKAGLNVESVENIGPHYARTLREWRYRFERNFESHIRPALHDRYPSLTSADVEIFRRKWIYYFAYCEAGFGIHVLSDHVFTLTREANLRL